MSSCIYSIKCVNNNNLYIGSSKNFIRRKSEHLRELNMNKHTNKYLQNSYNKYGVDSLVFNILAHCPEEYQYKLEQWFLDNLHPEFNICCKVLTPPVIEITDEIRRKMSIRQSERMNTPEYKEKMICVVNSLWKDPKHVAFMKEINKGENHPQHKITEETVRQVKLELENTPTYYGKRKYICRKYNITVHMYKDIQRNKVWKHVKV